MIAKVVAALCFAGLAIGAVAPASAELVLVHRHPHRHVVLVPRRVVVVHRHVMVVHHVHHHHAM